MQIPARVVFFVLAAAALGLSLMSALALEVRTGRPSAESLPVPLGATREQVIHGQRVYYGEAAEGKCAECHGLDAKGGTNGNDLTSGLFIWSDGSVKGLKASILHNMAVAPGRDGNLTPADVDAVAVYLWAISRPNRCPTSRGDTIGFVQTDCPLP